MAKVKKVSYILNEKINKIQYWINCPGCGHEHAIELKEDDGPHAFNQNFEKPTLSPSLLVNFSPDRRCHSFVKDGNIQFLNDCYHNLKGKTVELPDWDTDHMTINWD